MWNYLAHSEIQAKFLQILNILFQLFDRFDIIDAHTFNKYLINSVVLLVFFDYVM